MDLLKLLRTEASLDLRRMLAMSIIAGLSNVAVLALINVAANRRGQADGGRLALMFIIVVTTYTVSQRYVMIQSAREVERIVHRIRSRLIEALRRCELRDIERIGRTRIYSALSTEIQTVASPAIFSGWSARWRCCWFSQRSTCSFCRRWRSSYSPL
jgi:putative ATP-binding cassette transporter